MHARVGRAHPLAPALEPPAESGPAPVKEALLLPPLLTRGTMGGKPTRGEKAAAPLLRWEDLAGCDTGLLFP